MAIQCDYCGRPAKLVAGNSIYPNKPELANKAFWVCYPCNARVGCHNGTTRPLGRMANTALRRWRRKAHEAFDPVWREGHRNRKSAYKWLAKSMGIPVDKCHIAMFSVADCKKVIEICENATAVQDK